MCPADHALLIYLYHLTYPTTLLRMQSEFGRERSQLCRLENEIKSFMIMHYRHCVIGNLMWYEDRFPEYAEPFNRKVVYSLFNLLAYLELSRRNYTIL